MPNSDTHDKITVALAAPIGVAAIVATDWTLGLMVLAGYLIGGFMMNGDLDLNSTPYHRWGPLRIIWWPYQKLVRHRSRWSHWPFLGTVSRIVYLGVISSILFAAPIYFGLIDLHAVSSWCVDHVDQFAVFVVGLEAGALSHTLADWIL